MSTRSKFSLSLVAGAIASTVLLSPALQASTLPEELQTLLKDHNLIKSAQAKVKV